MPEWVKVAETKEVAEGQVRVVEAKGQRLALSHVGGEFFALEDLCTHDNGPLGEGSLSGDLIECPRHGARFSVRTGQPVTLPAVLPVKTYPVKVSGSEIFVHV